MNLVARSLLYALGNILHPRMLWLMLWPVLIALALWGAVALVFWTQIALWLADLIHQWLTTGWFAIQWDVKDLALIAAKAMIVILLVPLVQLTALLILSTFGMPSMVEHVASRSYAGLERRRGGSLAGSLWNGLVALAGMALLFVLSIPLWFFPPFWPLIPVATMRPGRVAARSTTGTTSGMASIMLARLALSGIDLNSGNSPRKPVTTAGSARFSGAGLRMRMRSKGLPRSASHLRGVDHASG